MTPEEAKSQLDACTLRPGDADAEARALASTDTELKTWLAARTARDEHLAECFNEAPIPAGLRDRLVATMETQTQEPVIEQPASKRRPTVFRSVAPWLALGAAAAIAAISTLGPWWRAADNHENWQTEALGFVNEIDAGKLRLDKFSDNLDELKSGLAEAKSPTPGGLPKSITGMSSLGCKTIQVAGRSASVICFEIVPGKEAHLVVIDNAKLGNVPPQHQPQFDQHGAWRVASWSDGPKSYLLATQAEEKDLRRLFSMVWRMPAEWPA